MALLAGALVLCAACGALLAACARLRGVRCRCEAMATPCTIAVLVGGSAAGGILAERQPGIEAALVVATLATCAIASTITDARNGVIVDRVTIPATALILTSAVAAGQAGASVEGSLASGGTLGLLWMLSRGRAIGLGDIKFAACIGAALGSVQGELALGVAFVLGGVYAVTALMRGARRSDATCFAPYLAIASFAVMWWRTP